MEWLYDHLSIIIAYSPFTLKEHCGNSNRIYRHFEWLYIAVVMYNPL